MGTDITLIVERRNSEGQWERVEAWVPDPFYDSETEVLKIEQGYPQCLMGPLKRESWYETRDHLVFAILAGLKNRYPDIVPISKPRGLPHDAADETRDELVFWETHDTGWLTLAELVAFDWSQPPPSNFWENTGWISYSSDGEPEISSSPPPDFRYPTTLAEACSEFYQRVIPRLRGIGAKDDVRVVFGFDS